ARNASAVAGSAARRAAVSRPACTRPTLVPVLCAMKWAALRSPEARHTLDSSTRLATNVRPAASTRSPSVMTSSRRSASGPLRQPGSSADRMARWVATVACSSWTADIASPADARNHYERGSTDVTLLEHTFDRKSFLTRFLRVPQRTGTAAGPLPSKGRVERADAGPGGDRRLRGGCDRPGRRRRALERQLPLPAAC